MRAALLTAALLLCACGGEADPPAPVCLRVLEANPYLCCPDPQLQAVMAGEQCLTEDYTIEDYDADRRAAGCRPRHRCSDD